MRAFVLFITIVLLGFGAHQLLPWWAVGGIALLASAVVGLRPLRSFFIGFFAAGLLWGGMAAWLHHAGNEILALRIGELFGGLPPLVLFIITGVLGGLLGGFGALTGSLGRELTR